MVRTQIQLTEEQSQTLKAIAQEQGVSIAELIRQSIDRFIRSRNQPTLDERRQRALSIVGIASSGVPDLATEHDRYLAEAYGNFGE
ncbi:MAG: ribbon-helix-helix domain-containing protein [Chloroflexi bacterium]|nr:ribbon-helix-helix domain-containing protein [Chloroflexota bacterium]